MKLRIATWNLERPQTGQTEKIDALVARMQAIDADIWENKRGRSVILIIAHL